MCTSELRCVCENVCYRCKSLFISTLLVSQRVFKTNANVQKAGQTVSLHKSILIPSDERMPVLSLNSCLSKLCEAATKHTLFSPAAWASNGRWRDSVHQNEENVLWAKGKGSTVTNRVTLMSSGQYPCPISLPSD